MNPLLRPCGIAELKWMMKMSSVRFWHTTAVVAAGLVVAGCGATQPKVQSGIQEPLPRQVKLHTQDSLLRASREGRAFALIGKAPSSDTWELISASAKFPAVSAGQEVLLVSDDLKRWETTTPRFQDCSKPSAGYSVCSSALAQKDWLGYANYNSDAVVRAVNSIPEYQAKTVMQSYLNAEDAAALSKYEEKRKEQTECYANHEADSREIETAGGKAMASAIAGKPLKPEEMAAIRRAQQRMSASSVCGYNVQPPKKRASVGG